jgi:hypothetical protein
VLRASTMSLSGPISLNGWLSRFSTENSTSQLLAALATTVDAGVSLAPGSQLASQANTHSR